MTISTFAQGDNFYLCSRTFGDSTLAGTAEESYGGEEEGASGYDHEDDCVAVGSLGGGWSGGGVVAALGAALRSKRRGQQSGEEQDQCEYSGGSRAHVPEAGHGAPGLSSVLKV